MKKLTLAAASVLTLALAVPMLASAERSGRGHGGHLEKLDTNGDGVIARGEVEASALEAFAEMDADANGQLTQEELKAGHEAKRAARKAAWAEKHPDKEMKERKPRGDRDPAKMEAFKAKMQEKAAERFAAVDTDGNGSWSSAEFTAHRLGFFTKVDTDSDGNITAAERDAAKAKMKDKMKERRGKWRDKPAEQ